MKSKSIVLFFAMAFILLAFEVAHVYFIMPMPGGSQNINSIDVAYFLHSYRWLLRGILTLLFLYFACHSLAQHKIKTLSTAVAVFFISYTFNDFTAADTMFLQPQTLRFETNKKSSIAEDKIILGYHNGAVAKAYPIQLVGYHHQIRDTINDTSILITYCTVCRTGRAYSPIIAGRAATFRLVGMDHYNAMFEDDSTKSWWRQATGEAIAGVRKGDKLLEIPLLQCTLKEWLGLYPNSLIMQPDTLFELAYGDMKNYENGLSIGSLTKYDTCSWERKSWIVGVNIDGLPRAYDWNELLKYHVIVDSFSTKKIIVTLANDNKSFAALLLPDSSATHTIRMHNDSVWVNAVAYHWSGKSLDSTLADLPQIQAYQEYWHSWNTFQPTTTK